MDDIIKCKAKCFWCNIMKRKKFDQQVWFKMAYSTLSRCASPKSQLGDNEGPLKNEFKKLIFETLKKINSDNYKHEISEYFKKACKIHEAFNIGRSQKVINILLKYFYVYKLTQSDEDINKLSADYPFLNAQNFFSAMHIPIDSQVLKNIKKAENVDEKNINIVAWSKLIDCKKYNDFQDEVKKLAKNKNIKPIDYEMLHLWRVESNS